MALKIESTDKLLQNKYIQIKTSSELIILAHVFNPLTAGAAYIRVFIFY